MSELPPIEYPFPLSHGGMVRLFVPSGGISAVDAERLREFISALVVEEEIVKLEGASGA